MALQRWALAEYTNLQRGCLVISPAGFAKVIIETDIFKLQNLCCHYLSPNVPKLYPLAYIKWHLDARVSLVIPMQVLLLTILRPKWTDSLPAASHIHLHLPPSTPGTNGTVTTCLSRIQMIQLQAIDEAGFLHVLSCSQLMKLVSARFKLQPIDEVGFLHVLSCSQLMKLAFCSMCAAANPLSRQLPPGREQQRQQQHCGGVTNCSHKRPHRSAPTGMHSMVQPHNYHKDVGSVDEFPTGLRVLVVDDDPICLMILEQMLH
jgi:hypothetical protein